MPPGWIVGLAASSHPDAGLRLSNGRPDPPHGENGSQTGRRSPATTRQRPGAYRESTPSPGESHHGSRLAIDDPSSPVAPGSSGASSVRGRRSLARRERPELTCFVAAETTRGAGVAVVSGSLRSSSAMGLSQPSRRDGISIASRPVFSLVAGAVRARCFSPASTGTPYRADCAESRGHGLTVPRTPRSPRRRAPPATPGSPESRSCGDRRTNVRGAGSSESTRQQRRQAKKAW